MFSHHQQTRTSHVLWLHLGSHLVSEHPLLRSDDCKSLPLDI